jgi:hypothetical protein
MEIPPSTIYNTSNLSSRLLPCMQYRRNPGLASDPTSPQPVLVIKSLKVLGSSEAYLQILLRISRESFGKKVNSARGFNGSSRRDNWARRVWKRDILSEDVFVGVIETVRGWRSVAVWCVGEESKMAEERSYLASPKFKESG